MTIFIDSHSTTQPSRRVVDAVCETMRCCGNAASAHVLGRAMAARVAQARRQVAAAAGGVDPGLVVFTSGATEANNLAMRGTIAAFARDGAGRRLLIVSAVEHSSVLATARALEAARRADVLVLPVTPTGAVDPALLERALQRYGTVTALVCVMVANNEVGTINDLGAILAVCRRAGVLLLADDCQGFAKLALRPGVADFISASAHKIRGPTGVGALIFGSAGLRDWIVPQMTGGTHEDGVRAGTANTHGIVGFGVAAEETRAAWGAAGGGEGARLARLRDLLWSDLRSGLGDEWVRLNGPPLGPGRLPQNLNVTLAGVCPISLDEAVRDRVAVSGAAACRSLGGERSHVLAAIGSPDDGATVRFGLGENDEAQVRQIARIFIDAAKRLRGSDCPIPQRR